MTWGECKTEVGEDDLRKTRKEYFEDLYNLDIEERAAVNMFDFDDDRRGNYYGDSQSVGLKWKRVKNLKVKMRLQNK